MTDAINTYSRNLPGGRQGVSPAKKAAPEDASASAASGNAAPVVSAGGAAAGALRASAAPADDSLELSPAARRVMSDAGFDKGKVEAIKQALKEGTYPLDSKRIAESFVALERMIGD